MLTIFSTTKAFAGRFADIQRNAVASWVQIDPRPEVILFGSDPGTNEICAELGIRHVPEVATSGPVPLVSDMFAQAQRLATYDVLTFVNADIILPRRFARLVRTLETERSAYLAIGRRTDVSITGLVDFGPDWERQLAAPEADPRLMPANWIDHFTFPRGLYTDIPAFAVGRSGYDNWLIWRAEQAGARVIDVTRFCSVYHQRHDYSHADGARAVFGGADARRAQALVGDWRRYYSVAHARWMLNEAGDIQPARGWSYRLARPRRALAHALRFTVPLRRRLIDLRLARKLRRMP